MKNVQLIYPQKQSIQEILNKTKSNKLQKFQPNGLIYGDAIIALSSLLNLKQHNQIKDTINLVYIDPPFATNQIFRVGESRTMSKVRSDKIAYKDAKLDYKWLDFIRTILILLYELMSDNASIYLHLDWRSVHYVKIFMDEIFGEQHFINHITRIKCNPKDFKRKAYGNITDAILFYSKTKNYIWNDSREEFTQEQIKKLYPKIDKNGLRYTTQPLHAAGQTISGESGTQWQGIKPPPGSHWVFSHKKMDELNKNNLIEWSKNKVPRYILYAKDAIIRGKKRQNLWEFKDPQYPKYPTEKNLNMLKVIIEASSNPNDIVLDCFAGSGTTLFAAEQLGRKWIGVQNSKQAIDIIKKRLIDTNYNYYEVSNE